MLAGADAPPNEKLPLGAELLLAAGASPKAKVGGGVVEATVSELAPKLKLDPLVAPAVDAGFGTRPVPDE
jgi:hypothetical protein